MKRIIFFISVMIYIVCYPNGPKIRTELSNINDTLKVVKKVSANYTNGNPEPEEVWTFFYENDLISKIESLSDGKITASVEINYEDGKIKEMKDYIKPLKSLNEISVLRVFNYDKDLITNILTTESQRKILYMYTYNDLKQIIKCQISENGKLLSEEAYLYDKKGNLSERKYEGQSKKDMTFYKSYDDKHNSFGLIYSEAYLKIISMAKNNILHSYNYDGGVDKYQYEYNSKNYPTKITLKRNGQIQNITTIQYE
ncbi:MULTISPECIES: hypothetical protein [Flavobacterium]|nr:MULTISPECIES: hypothetical protein [Flavobacterium]OOV18722.1 hypothetical protein BXU10_03270 [Flavobacterium sp. LM4]